MASLLQLSYFLFRMALLINSSLVNMLQNIKKIISLAMRILGVFCVMLGLGLISMCAYVCLIYIDPYYKDRFVESTTTRVLSSWFYILINYNYIMSIFTDPGTPPKYVLRKNTCFISGRRISTNTSRNRWSLKDLQKMLFYETASHSPL
jgi:hypothetical protein